MVLSNCDCNIKNQMNFIKSTVISNLESFRDYLEQQDEELQKRPKYCVDYFAPKEAVEF